MAKVYYPGIGTREATPLSHVEKFWADIAHTTLLPFRNRDVVESIQLSGERADRLEMAICEALVNAYQMGRDDEKLQRLTIAQHADAVLAFFEAGLITREEGVEIWDRAIQALERIKTKLKETEK